MIIWKMQHEQSYHMQPHKKTCEQTIVFDCEFVSITVIMAIKIWHLEMIMQIKMTS